MLNAMRHAILSYVRRLIPEELSTVESIVTNVEKRLNTRLDSLEEKVV